LQNFSFKKTAFITFYIVSDMLRSEIYANIILIAIKIKP